DRRAVGLECQTRLRLAAARVLADRRSVVGEAGLADVLDAVGGGATPVQQIAQEQALLRRRHDARHPLRHDQVAGRGGVTGDGGLDAQLDAASTRGGESAELIRLCHLLAQALGPSRGAAALQRGHHLLSGLQTGLQLALGDQQLVNLGLGLRAHLGMALDLLLGALSVGFQLVVNLLEARSDGLDIVFQRHCGYSLMCLMRDAATAAASRSAAESLAPRSVASRSPLPAASRRLDLNSLISRMAAERDMPEARSAASRRRTAAALAFSPSAIWSDASSSSAKPCAMASEPPSHVSASNISPMAAASRPVRAA